MKRTMKDQISSTMAAAVTAALFGALILVAITFGLSLLPDIGSIPTPTGGELDLGMLGQTPLLHAAIGGAVSGVVFLLLLGGSSKPVQSEEQKS